MANSFLYMHVCVFVHWKWTGKPHQGVPRANPIKQEAEKQKQAWNNAIKSKQYE